MAVHDVHQHSIKHRPETLTAGKRSKRSIRQLHRDTSTSSSSLATDPVEAYQHLQRNEWKFFLTEWDAEISPSSIGEVDAAWVNATSICNSSTPEDLMQRALLMVSEAAQTAHFQQTEVPTEILSRCHDFNRAAPVKFSDKRLKRDTNSMAIVHRSPYEYKSGVSKILNRADRAHLWAITSYVMNFNLLASEERRKVRKT